LARIIPLHLDSIEAGLDHGAAVFGIVIPTHAASLGQLLRCCFLNVTRSYLSNNSASRRTIFV
jgi:hypothetical protein